MKLGVTSPRSLRKAGLCAYSRAHVGIAGNKRADKFVRRAAFTKKASADYDRFPLSHANKRVLRQIEMTSQMAQILTDHGWFAQYLFRLKLLDSPYCTCDPSKIQNVLHVLEDSTIFYRESVALETGWKSRSPGDTSWK
ncbi:hypothetical protein EVAR_96030_1 [Eumeta japonica]|uniref:RNase H type-1 domain-containing protein n=1 Tax=Eumeta variegata TaxID=151549 RepID=A0A4C1XHX5_EUMVA|nr:hypothetical protein EVAR_96030_1 [Eumeta japonica]